MSSRNQTITASAIGFFAATALLTLYAVIIVAISGWAFAEQQFGATWHFVVSLALGFGIQVGLYAYLRQSITQRHAGGKVVAVSGTTSTTAMLACCAHYLANVAPLLGLAGAISLIGQYQQQLFWVGILFNLAGIAYLVWRLIQFNTHESHSAQLHSTI
ncbi:MAG TPA: hypothetical protein VJB68_03280 [Methylophilaceae bacterium]|nr:hypothetical protein [Methylophilaceae bacterium]